jgi:hypothetical protein
MPDIDDPIEQLREQLKGEHENIAMALAKHEIGKIPFIGFALNHIRGKEKAEKEDFIDNAILDILKTHDITIDKVLDKLELENMVQVVAVAAERVFWGASKKKAKRFAAVVANTIESAESEQDFEEAAYFIRALDELSEDDIRVLKHLYSHQKHILNENHALTYNEFFNNNGMKNMLLDARNLGMQMDEFYARLHRLSGYGLALPLDKSHGSMGNPDDFAFRMTLLGRRLVDMLVRGGESTDVRLGQPAGVRPA